MHIQNGAIVCEMFCFLVVFLSLFASFLFFVFNVFFLTFFRLFFLDSPADDDLPMVLDGYNLYSYIMGGNDERVRDHLIFHMKPYSEFTLE